jgi:hypothetical protein
MINIFINGINIPQILSAWGGVPGIGIKKPEGYAFGFSLNFMIYLMTNSL